MGINVLIRCKRGNQPVPKLGSSIPKLMMFTFKYLKTSNGEIEVSEVFKGSKVFEKMHWLVQHLNYA